jgi:hypothetical protein
MTNAVMDFLTEYKKTVTVPEHLPLVCLAAYLFHDAEQAEAHNDRAEKLYDLFYHHHSPDYFKQLEELVQQDADASACLQAAREAATEGLIERYEKDYDFDRFEQDKRPIPEFYTISFLLWAEKHGYVIDQRIIEETKKPLEVYFLLKQSRDEDQRKFPKIDRNEFEHLTSEPLWLMSDAFLYALGFKGQTNEKDKITFLRFKSKAKRLKKYALDAYKAGDLKLFDFNNDLYENGWGKGDQFEFGDTELQIEVFYEAKVKPADFVTWLRGLPLDIPILEGKVVDTITSHIQSGGYTTPYIDLIFKAIRELNISAENQPLKKHIVEWLLQQNPDLSERETSMIATILRLPEMKKGGYHRLQK